MLKKCLLHILEFLWICVFQNFKYKFPCLYLHWFHTPWIWSTPLIFILFIPKLSRSWILKLKSKIGIILIFCFRILIYDYLFFVNLFSFFTFNIPAPTLLSKRDTFQKISICSHNTLLSRIWDFSLDIIFMIGKAALKEGPA